MARVFPLLIVGAIALSACAPTTTSTERTESVGPERQCLFQDQIQSFRVRDQSIFLRGSGKTVFQLEATGYCRDLDGAMGLAFLPQGGLNQICTGDWTMIVPNGATPPVTPCRVRIVRKLSDAEIAALPARDRP